MTLYYENGNIQTKSINKDGQLNGLVTYYNEKGEKTREETYTKGKLIK